MASVFLYIFLPLKLLAYIWWAYMGFSYLKLYVTQPKLCAMMYGLIRLLTGLLLAMALLVMAMLIFDPQHPVLSGIIAYLIIYIPVRWLEWGILEFIMNPKSRSFDFLIFGVNGDARRWRVGGIILCAVLDAPFIFLTKGASLGNFYMC